MFWMNCTSLMYCNHYFVDPLFWEMLRSGRRPFNGRSNSGLKRHTSLLPLIARSLP
jgi:hypothetical protein